TATTGSILLNTSSSFTQDATSTLSAPAHRITIHVGGLAPATLTLDGTVTAPLTDLYGGAQGDTITVHPVAILGYMRIFGQGGDDTITLDALPTIDLAGKFSGDPTDATSLVNGTDAQGRPATADGVPVPLRDMVEVDGGGGADHVIVTTSSRGDVLVSVHDSGAPADGSDTLTINGSPDA